LEVNKMVNKLVKKLAALVAAPLLALAAVPAQASYIWISDGTNATFIYDQQAGDLASNVGQVAAVLNNWYGWTLTVTNGVGYPAQGTLDAPNVHLNVSASGIGDLFVVYYDINLANDGTGPYNAGTGLPWDATAGGALGTGATMDWMACAGDSYAGCAWYNDGTFGFAGLNYGTLGAMAGFGDLSGLTDQATAYGTAIFAHLHHTANDTSSMDLSLNIPEPGTLALLGLGLAGLGFVGRRKKSA
jgi:hypothetical protein